MQKLDDFLRIKDASEYLGVAPNTLRNWESAGKIAVFRHPVNNYRLFSRSDLDEILRRLKPSNVNKPR